ncbi:MAG: sulfide/dihydroorotate dehydrogenase-like FAD/NAD-binding protein [Candidatus Marinimicrobia bacterium]|nr:sulfide/dihydroorotate dehydrogenase-like FAD/NAD-binding protein [Candidatus Neomarinimicrobiota bacterium]
MNLILQAEFIAPDIKKFVIAAPLIARKAKPGQFVILRVWEKGERIPITIVNGDPENGTVTLIIQGLGKTTRQMNMLNSGDYVHDLVGPLGQATHIENFGLAVCVSGGVGTAEALPIARALKEAGNTVIAIIGAREKALVICEAEMRTICDEVIITTDDGSYGTHGLVTDVLKTVIASDTKPDFVLAVGPLPMMRAVSEMTRPFSIKTMVSLNSIMVDGTGMCGGCRATVDGKTVFVCVDGPEFDGHQVNFDEIARRQKQFANQEKISAEIINKEPQKVLHQCRLAKAINEISKS